MPDVDGLALQQLLFDSGIERPIIFVTGRGDIPTSVRAMRAGAVDFLTKPVSGDALLAAVARARQLDAQAPASPQRTASIEARLATLTPREREVLTHVVAGRLNKQIAGDLGTVEKTIKVHRGRMMSKLGVRTVQDLVRLAERAGIRPRPQSGRAGEADAFCYGHSLNVRYPTFPIGPKANSTASRGRDILRQPTRSPGSWHMPKTLTGFVAIVDDDTAVRKALSRLLSASAIRAQCFGSAREFLDSLASGAPECLSSICRCRR